jgi:uncharacterized protein
MNCPICKRELKSAQYEGIAIEGCETCEGHWLDAGALSQIIRARQVKFDAANRRTAAKAPRTPGIPKGEGERRISCPSCDCPMPAFNYGSDSGIVVNRCPECDGMWLDRGELDRIQMLVEGIEDFLA